MQDCKNQILSTLKNNNCCSLAFLNVVISCSSQISLKKSHILINIDNSLKSKVIQIISNFYPNLEIDDWDNFLLLRGNIYEFLNGINFDNNISLDCFPSDCDKITILKTFFLLNGHFYYNQDNSINSKGYSLEFSLTFSNNSISLLSLRIFKKTSYSSCNIQKF